MKSYATPMFFFLLCLLTTGLPLHAGVSTGSPGTELGQPVEGSKDARLTNAGLITFAAAPAGNMNRLQWSMINDAQVATVTVERAARGTTEWVALTVYRPESKGDELTEYEYIDVSPTAEAGYRLRFVLSDGSFAVSETVVVVRAFDLFTAPQVARYTIGYQGAQ